MRRGSTYFKANHGVGGVCGKSWYGTIANCYNKGDVSGTDHTGGVCGYIQLGTITSSYNTGKVSGTASIGGVCGRLDKGTITNCYYDSINYTGNAVGSNYDDIGIISENVLGKTTDEFKSGEVAYLLNGSKSVSEEDNPLVWYQNIDNGTEDAYPVLDSTHGIVYIGNPCAVYTNIKDKNHRYIISADGKSHTCSDCGMTEQHADVAQFSTNDDEHTITAACPAGCELGKIKLSASDATYDGDQKSATKEGAIKGFDIPSIVYEVKTGEEYTVIGSTPTDAGTYRASITYTVGEEPENKYSVSVEYTIEKAKYEKIENFVMQLDYDSVAKSYTATIESVDGAEYKFGESGEWSTDFTRTGIEPHTTVTGYIRMAGDKNHNPSEESSRTLTTGHGTLEHVEEKDVDCVTDGNKEYWYCESCKKYYSDENGNIEEENVTIKATGH